MIELQSQNTVTQLEESTTSLSDWDKMRQAQMDDLIDLVKTQGAMLAQLQTDVLLLRTENQNWATLFQLLPTPREIRGDEGPFGDPRTPEEIRMDIITSQPGYVYSDPFAGYPDDADKMNTFYSGVER